MNRTNQLVDTNWRGESRHYNPRLPSASPPCPRVSYICGNSTRRRRCHALPRYWESEIKKQSRENSEEQATECVLVSKFSRCSLLRKFFIIAEKVESPRTVDATARSRLLFAWGLFVWCFSGGNAVGWFFLKLRSF